MIHLCLSFHQNMAHLILLHSDRSRSFHRYDHKFTHQQRYRLGIPQFFHRYFRHWPQNPFLMNQSPIQNYQAMWKRMKRSLVVASDSGRRLPSEHSKYSLIQDPHSLDKPFVNAFLEPKAGNPCLKFSTDSPSGPSYNFTSRTGPDVNVFGVSPSSVV